ncbi:MAG: hypothetical protein A4S16_09105 [Proteobacteria bacterium SG_bin6]|nr:MAG: hypothetical protein A4S16_09105 [Proteobacteria bacterium SG_bin6]
MIVAAGTTTRANVSGDVPAAVAEEPACHIREQKLVRPALIGHSMGGTIGTMLATPHPSRRQAINRAIRDFKAV